MANESVATIITRGLWDENPVMKLLLGLCPALAVTSTALDGAGMGACTTFVLVCSNVVVSVLKPIIPSRMRLPCFIVVIASFVTIVDLVVAGYFISLSKSLGIFIPLIVVNCVILGRAEAFASKNPIWKSALDGVGMGIGFTLALTAMGVIREILGNGSVFGFEFGKMLFGDDFAPLIVMILPPGAFLTLGYMIALKVMIDRRRAS
jgi:Na+-translocating ferredoxin:NAD+ oxidoreductase subunit E